MAQNIKVLHLYGSRDLRLDYVKKPKIEPNEVLIRVRYVGSVIVIRDIG